MDIKVFKKSLKSIVDGNPEKGIKGIVIDNECFTLDRIVSLELKANSVILETADQGVLAFCGSPDMLIDIIKE